MIGPRDASGKRVPSEKLAKVPRAILDAEQAAREAYSKYQDACGFLHQVIAEEKAKTGYTHPWPFQGR